MSKRHIPQMDSIEELAKFWDTHDLTDFQDELEEVAASVFERKENAALTIRLQPSELEAVGRIAEAQGIKQTDLVKQWVLEKIHAT